MKSLYIHIPFCAKKCLYCDFNSYANRELENQYVKTIISQINDLDYNFNTIFIGGGTPTILSNENLKSLLEALNKFSPKEFSIECNPGTINKENLFIMKDFGVNRLSIGLQSTNNNILKSLGRIHTYEDFLNSYVLAREVGFKNINIDLMFGVPNQSLEDFKESLEKVCKLKPEHISSYSLIIEEGTPFYEMDKKGELNVVSEDVEREMYDFLIDYLKDKGYKWYEISNFCLNGKECEHNKVYWKCEDYIGIGAGAHSYFNGKRYSNVCSVKEYIEKSKSKDNSYIENIEVIDKNSSIEENMFLGLRMIDGINKKEFENRFNESINDIYQKEIEKLKENDLIFEDENIIKLTRKGVNLSNQVFVEFLK